MLRLLTIFAGRPQFISCAVWIAQKFLQGLLVILLGGRGSAGQVFAGALEAEQEAFQASQVIRFVPLEVPLPALPQTLHPGLSQTPSERWIMQSLYTGLFQWSHPAKIIPGVCISMERPSPKEWILHLSENALWSNGEQILSSDFLRTWEGLVHADLPRDHPLKVLGLIGSVRRRIFSKKSAALVNVSAPNPHSLLLTFKQPLLDSVVLQALADERLAPVHPIFRECFEKAPCAPVPTNGRFAISSITTDALKTRPNFYYEARSPQINLEKNSSTPVFEQVAFPLSLKDRPTLYHPFSRTPPPALSGQRIDVRMPQIISLSWTKQQKLNTQSIALANALALLLSTAPSAQRWQGFEYNLPTLSVLPMTPAFVPLSPRWKDWPREKREEAAFELLRAQQWDPQKHPLNFIAVYRNSTEQEILRTLLSPLSRYQGIFVSLITKEWFELQHPHPHKLRLPDFKAFDIQGKINTPLVLTIELFSPIMATWSPEEILSRSMQPFKGKLNTVHYEHYLQSLEEVEEAAEYSDTRCQAYRDLEAFFQRTHTLIPMAQAQRPYFFAASEINAKARSLKGDRFYGPQGLLDWGDLELLKSQYCPFYPLAPQFVKEQCEEEKKL